LRLFIERRIYFFLAVGFLVVFGVVLVVLPVAQASFFVVAFAAFVFVVVVVVLVISDHPFSFYSWPF
jgi:hypothetical protein